MAELTLGTTAELIGTPPVVVDTTSTPHGLATVTLESATVVDQTGASVAHSLAGETATLTSTAIILGMRITATFRWRVTYFSGDYQFQTTTVSAWVVDATYAHYGSIDGVQNYVKQFLTFGEATTSAEAVARLLSAKSTTIDLQLSAKGYVVPVTAESALPFLGHIADRLVAYEVASQHGAARVDPNMQHVISAWRAEAASDLELALCGGVSLRDILRDGLTEGSRTPTVISSGASVPLTSITDFQDRYGGRSL